MSKINLLMTGLSIVNSDDFKIGNFDYSWLMEHPSSLLWADKILITSSMADSIFEGRYPDKGGPFSKSLSLIFEILENQQIIKIKDPNKVFNSELSDKIGEEINREIGILSKMFPDNVKIDLGEESPANIFINKQGYCPTHIWSIYASLIISNKWNAQCLFSDHSINFLKYKFGSSLITDKGTKSLPKSFDTIFSSFLPDYNFFPYYVYGSSHYGQCKECVHIKKCESSYLGDLEENLYKYLDFRDYDEIKQIKNVLHKINKKLGSKNHLIDHESIMHEFKEEERLISKRIHSTFPKIKRWSNISIMASLLISSVGVFTGLPTVSEACLSAAGISKLTERYIKHLEDKYKWVGFKINDIP